MAVGILLGADAMPVPCAVLISLGKVVYGEGKINGWYLG